MQWHAEYTHGIRFVDSLFKIAYYLSREFLCAGFPAATIIYERKVLYGNSDFGQESGGVHFTLR